MPDPVAEYLRQYGQPKASDPVADYLGTYGKPDNGVGGVEGALLGVGMAGATMLEGIGNLVGADVSKVRRRREADAERVAGGGTDALVGAAVGGIATNVAVSMLPAVRVGRLLKGASRATRYAGMLASQAPVSAAIGAAGKEMSTTEMFADIGDKVSEDNAVSRRLHELGEGTGTRALTDVALDALTAGAVDVALRGGKAGYTGVRDWIRGKPSAPMGKGRLLTAGMPEAPPAATPQLNRGPIVTPPPAAALTPEEQAARGWEGLAEMEPQAGSGAWWRAQGAVPPERRLPRGPLVTPPPPPGPRLVPFESTRAGFTLAPVTGAIAGAGAGAVTGASFGDTPEERRRNSIIGAAVGAGVGGIGTAKLARLSTRGPSTTSHSSMSDPAVARVASKISFDPKRQIIPKWDSVKRAAAQFYDQFVEGAGGAEKLASNPPTPGLATAAKRFWTEMARTTSYVEPAALRMEEQLGPLFREMEQKGIGQAVGAYAAAKRALELARNGHVDKGFDLGDAAATVSRIEASFPEIVESSRKLTQYYKDLLEWKWREGVISDDQYQAIIKSGDYYIPFVRDFGLDKPTVMGMGSSTLNKIPGVRRMREGKASSAIVNPFHQAILDTFETSRRVAKQRATNAFADMLAVDPVAMSAIAREVPNPSSKAAVTAKNGTVIDVNIAGKRRYFEIMDERLARAFEALTPQTKDLGVKFLHAWGKVPLQTGVTTHPAFMLANFMRDQVSSAIRYPFALKQAGAGAVIGGAAGSLDGDEDGVLIGAIAGFGAGALAPNTYRTLQAMLDILSNTKSPVVAPAQAGAFIGALAAGDDGESRLKGALMGAAIGAGVGTAAIKFGDKDIVREWVREGGPGHGYFARTPFEAKQVMRDLMRHPGFDVADVITPHGWWDAITMVNRAIEQAPRLARYKYLTGTGAMPSGTTIPRPEAIISGKDISVNFERHGSSGAAKFLRDTQAFWNPAVQGIKWTGRTIKDPRAWGVIGGLLTAPSLALWWMNHDDPNYQRRPMAEKLMFWHIPKGDGNFWKIQKPHEIGWAFASLPEQFAQYLYEKDATRFGLAMKDVLGQVVSGVFPAPTLPKAAVEVALNHDTFRNRPIESLTDKSVLPRDRYDDRTSSFGTIVGQATGSAGVGPKKVDHAVRALTGTSGRFMAEEVGKVGRAFGLDPRGSDFTPVGEDRSEFSRFTTQPGVPTDDENLVWELFERSEQAWNSWRRRKEAGDDANISMFELEHEQDLDTYEVVNPVIRRMRELGRERRKVMGDRALTKEQRDHELLMISEESAQAATEALNRLKELQQ